MMAWETQEGYQGNPIKGLDVYGGDGEKVGTVNQVLADVDRDQYYILVESGPLSGMLGTDELYVPASDVQMVGEDRVVLETPSNRVQDQDWSNPPEGYRA